MRKWHGHLDVHSARGLSRGRGNDIIRKLRRLLASKVSSAIREDFLECSIRWLHDEIFFMGYKRKKMIKMLRTGLLWEHWLSAGASEPLLNQRLYSACSNTRIHLHKRGNYADKPRATQWNHPNTTKTRTCSKAREQLQCPNCPHTCRLLGSSQGPFQPSRGKKNIRIPCLCIYVP